jgi:hypothetical protein
MCHVRGLPWGSVELTLGTLAGAGHRRNVRSKTFLLHRCHESKDILGLGEAVTEDSVPGLLGSAEENRCFLHVPLSSVQLPFEKSTSENSGPWCFETSRVVGETLAS